MTIICAVLLFSGCVKQNDVRIVVDSSELTVEQSNEILRTIDWLPLGTVVSVDDSGQKVMIIGRIQQDANHPENKCEYSAVLYPQGLLNPEENYMFNFSQVKQIHFLGFSNEDNEMFEKQLDQYIEENNIVYN